MAHLTETATWLEAIYQLERTDPMTGGEDGIANRQAKQLANRTAYLKATLEALDIAVDTRIADSIAQLTADAPDTLNTLGAMAAALDNNTRVGAELSSALARLTDIETGLRTARYFDVRYAARNTASGWYTIATCQGARAVARFGVFDGGSQAHQSVIFYATHKHGEDAANTLTVLSNSHFANASFRHLRIKDGLIGEGAALQVFVATNTNHMYAALLDDNAQTYGWTMCDWIPDSDPPPEVINWATFTPKSQMDLAQIAQGGMATTGEIYAGGDLAQHQVIHTGTRGLIAPHHLTDEFAADTAETQVRLDGIDTALARGYVAKYQQEGLAAGWYTIATNKGGQDQWASRAIARFGIWDVGSSLHQAVIFYASHHFGTHGSNALTVLANSHHGGFPFKQIRIKENGTYDGAALQVYVDGGKHTVSVSAAILGDNMQHSGWVLRDWIPDSSNPPPDVLNWANFTPKSQMDLAQSAQGGMATTGDIYAGGDMTQHPVLHAGQMAGAITPFAMTTLPDGWLACHGGTVSRTTFARLFAAIGTMWGAGDGSTTFHLPDLRGEFLRGFDDGRGIDSGRAWGSSQGDAIRNITGGDAARWLGVSTSTDQKTVGAVYYNGGKGYGYTWVWDSIYKGQGIDFDASRVVPTASENRPRNIAITYGIKY